ncbi:MAG: hypothetical protein QF516_07150 [Pirellulaceae bacterium]|nr:hypothetical protein [Pirellulaceae bacterium]
MNSRSHGDLTRIVLANSHPENQWHPLRHTRVQISPETVLVPESLDASRWHRSKIIPQPAFESLHQFVTGIPTKTPNRWGFIPE